MIRLDNVSKSFDKRRVIAKLSCEIPDGSVTALVGEHDSGKSTLLKMIAGITSIDEGQIFVDGLEISQNPLQAKQKMAYTPETTTGFLRLKAVEYLSFLADVYGVPSSQRAARVAELARRLEVQNVLTHQMIGLSRSARQRIMAIGALLHNPAVWMMDQPFAGLDETVAKSLYAMMEEHARQGNTVVYTTTEIPTKDRCDEMIVLYQGNKVYQGKPSDIAVTEEENA